MELTQESARLISDSRLVPSRAESANVRPVTPWPITARARGSCPMAPMGAFLTAAPWDSGE